MEPGKAVAIRIKEICKDKNITMYYLSAHSGVPHTTLIDIMNGTTKNPGICTIKKLCDALEISLSYFFSSEMFK